MRILALVPSVYGIAPSQRYRIEQWEPLLRERGVEITYQPFDDEQLQALVQQSGHTGRKVGLMLRALVRRAAGLRDARQHDAVYILRETALLGPAIFERWLHRTGMPFVFDFDDAIFVPYKSPSNGYLSYLKFPGKTATVCRLAAHVMVGNDYLAEYARRFNPHVTVVPTTIDTARYTVEAHAADASAPPVIGWTGSFSTVQHLDTLRGALKRLAERERFRLRVVGAPHFRLEGVDVETVRWRAETEVADLCPLDIGVMPLPDEPWSRGKCAAKALQYMGLGIPTVCSPVGVNSAIIRDGENGFLANSEDEWVEKLTRLLRSPALRARLGQAGRATVDANYSAAVQAPRVYRIFASVVQQARGAVVIGDGA